MKKIINGKMYRTETATVMASKTTFLEKAVYKKENGEFFLHERFPDESEEITPLTIEQAFNIVTVLSPYVDRDPHFELPSE